MFDGSTLRMKGQILIHRLLVPVLFFVGINFVHAASFDCSKVTTETEQVICDDPKLSQLDELMAVAYEQAQAKGLPVALLSKLEGYRDNFIDRSNVVQEQQQAIKQRDKCKRDKACLADFYERRVNELLVFNKVFLGVKKKLMPSLLTLLSQFSYHNWIEGIASSDEGSTVAVVASRVTDDDWGEPSKVFIIQNTKVEGSIVQEVLLTGDAYPISDMAISPSSINIVRDRNEIYAKDPRLAWKIESIGHSPNRWRLTQEEYETTNGISSVRERVVTDFIGQSIERETGYRWSTCSVKLDGLPLSWDEFAFIKRLPKFQPSFLFLGFQERMFSPHSPEFGQFIEVLDDDQLRIYAIHAFSAKQLPAAKFAFEVLVDRSVPGALKDLKCVVSTIAAEK